MRRRAGQKEAKDTASNSFVKNSRWEIHIYILAYAFSTDVKSEVPNISTSYVKTTLGYANRLTASAFRPLEHPSKVDLSIFLRR